MKVYQQANKKKIGTYNKAYYEVNKEELKANFRAHYWTNKEERKVRNEVYYQKHKEKAKGCSRAWRREHKEEAKARNKVWRQKNKGLKNAQTRRRRAAKLNRTPGWLTPEQLQQITDFYVNCPEGMVVDHIIPLQGEYVSGFHHPDNLQYLTKSENCSKTNNYPVEGR